MTASAAVGVVEVGNLAVLVTLGPGGALRDRRRVPLTTGLPTHPYHHEGSWAVGRYAQSPWARPTTLPEALALVGRVREAARAGAASALAELAGAVPEPIGVLAVRALPALPAGDEAVIRDARAASMADAALYRAALAEAAEARGWRVRPYRREEVEADADAALGGALADTLAALGRAAKATPGPWRAEEKRAATAALVALRRG